jgi:hypothetical protein
MIGLAFHDERLLAFGVTTGNAINRRRVAAILTRTAARIGTSGNRLALAFAIATRLKIQRRAIDVAISRNLDFTFEVVEVEVVIATLGRRRNGHRLRRAEEHCGNGQDREHEFS